MDLDDNAKTITDFYYSDVLKYAPEINEKIRTEKTVKYMLDCGLTNLEIFKEIRQHKSKIITGEDLSNVLWKNSLIKKGAFYLHKELRIVSEAPIFDFLQDKEIIEPYFCEIKIRYTVTDVLNYFYKQLNSLSYKLVDRKTDMKTVAFLMNKYDGIDYVEALDVVLCSIDNHLKQHSDCYQLIDVTHTNSEVIKQLINDMLELESKDLRRIVWR